MSKDPRWEGRYTHYPLAFGIYWADGFVSPREDNEQMTALSPHAAASGSPEAVSGCRIKQDLNKTSARTNALSQTPSISAAENTLPCPLSVDIV